MALLWSTQDGLNLYEVRSAGACIRLYTNGVFHSQWNPDKPFSGHLWDLLCLPAFFCTQLNKALILGVGGGAAINTLNSCFQIERIQGVDLDAIHLSIARQFFQCNQENVRFECAEAKSFLNTHTHSYDLVIEDLFLGSKHEPKDARRAIKADQPWLELLSAKVNAGGVLLMNFESESQLRNCMDKLPRKRLGIQTLYSFRSKRYENAIAVLVKAETDLKNLELRATAKLGDKLVAKLLKNLDIRRI